MIAQLAEALQHQEPAVRSRDFLGLKSPRMRVRNEDRIDTGLESRVDVGLRRIADHPGACRVKPMFVDQLAIRPRVFLRNHGDPVKLRPQPGTLDFQPLLFQLSLGEERQLMPARQVGDRLRDPG